MFSWALVRTYLFAVGIQSGSGVRRCSLSHTSSQSAMASWSGTWWSSAEWQPSQDEHWHSSTSHAAAEAVPRRIWQSAHHAPAVLPMAGWPQGHRPQMTKSPTPSTLSWKAPPLALQHSGQAHSFAKFSRSCANRNTGMHALVPSRFPQP